MEVKEKEQKVSATDLERCIQIGQQVLKLLDRGVYRVEVYRYKSGSDKVCAVKMEDH